MDGSVMSPTQHGKVRERRRPAMRPMTYVMTLAKPNSTAREAAAAIAVVQRAPQRGRNRAGPRAHFYSPAVRIVPHDHASRIACQTAGRFL
jgi:hypothetical protein